MNYYKIKTRPNVQDNWKTAEVILAKDVKHALKYCKKQYKGLQFVVLPTRETAIQSKGGE